MPVCSVGAVESGVTWVVLVGQSADSQLAYVDVGVRRGCVGGLHHDSDQPVQRCHRQGRVDGDVVEGRGEVVEVGDQAAGVGALKRWQSVELPGDSCDGIDCIGQLRDVVGDDAGRGGGGGERFVEGGLV